MDKQQQLEIEAATFRRLVEHLRGQQDLQNIELMTLAGFCRNCLSKWYKAEAPPRAMKWNTKTPRDGYGMPYEQWKHLYHRRQPEQMRAFRRAQNQG